MDQLNRLFPYVWRHRTKVYLSIAFALVVAGLWTATLSLTFLVVKVLLQGESLNDYVETEIRAAQTSIEQCEKELDKAVTLKKADSARLKLSVASQRLVTLKWVQSRFVSWFPKDKFDTYAMILGVLILATTFKGVATYIHEVLVGSVVELTVMEVRKDCFRHVLQMDYQTLSLKGQSQLMSRFTNDIGLIATGLEMLGGKIVREPLKAVACIGAAFWVNWQLTLLSMILVPMMVVTFQRFGKRLRRASIHLMDRMSRIYKVLEETFDSLKVVIAYNGARRQRQRFHRDNKAYYHKAMKVVRIDALASPTVELLITLSVCLSLLPGAYLVLRDTDSIWGIKLTSSPMEIEQLSVLYVFLAGVLDPLRKLSSSFSRMKRAAAATERVFEIMDWKPLLNETEHPQLMPRHSQSIWFKKVSFTYATTSVGDRPPALVDINLKIAAGQVVVVVGENGSGKSTLVNLLPRFYDPEHGSVLIDGIDIRNVRLTDLRNQVGVVTQETLLFDDTIYENIRYGNFDATHSEILAAAEKARVPQFFDQLPEGFNTKVGPRGSRLSGGQRQRVALARALVRDPSILILDEATSAVDAQSESLIHQCLGDFVKGRTVFLITHSVAPQILEFATLIVLMEQGRIVQAGPHEELLKSCPEYQNLYRAQNSARGGEITAELPSGVALQIEDADESPDNADAPLLIKFSPVTALHDPPEQSESRQHHRKASR